MFNFNIKFSMFKRTIATKLLVKNDNSISLVNHFGSDLYVFNNQRISGKLKYKIFENNELKYILDNVKSDDVCMDIGANIGAYTTIFASKCSEVFAIEPVLKNSLLLKLTKLINGYENINVLNCIASDIDGEAEILICGETGFSGIYAGRGHLEYLESCYQQSDFSISKLKSIKIDSLQLKRLDVLKIDVEGAEMKVVNGGLNSIGSLKPRLIMIEVVDSAMALYSSSSQELLKVMDNLGYVPNVLSNNKLMSYRPGCLVKNDNIVFTLK